MLKGKKALVTGGTRGIGKAIVEEFCENGADVVLFSRSLKDKEAFLDQFKKYGTYVEYYPLNISDHESVKKTVEAAVAGMGGVDILVNNAGITQDASIKKMTIDNWNTVVDINLTGTFNMISAVIPYMVEQNSGKIVNLSSASAHGEFGQTNYAATKAGILGMTKTLAIELAKYKINVNAISPGFTMTEMTDAIPDKVKDRYFKAIPLGRGAAPKEIAHLVKFLASSESDFITGAEIPIDGGYKIF